MRRFPWSKSKKRGASKSVAIKLKEQQQVMDSFLIKTYLDDLKSHPQYAREIAREKFGMPEHYESGESEAPDLLEVLKTANEAKKLLKSELGTEEGSWLKTIGQSFAEAFAPLLSEMVAGKLSQGLPPPEVKELTEAKPKTKKDEVKEQQKAIKQYIETLFAKEPEEIALELYESRDRDGDLRTILWQYITENDFDTLVTLLDKIPDIPNYAFLKPLISKLDKKKLALVFDEANRINSIENTEEAGISLEQTADNEE